MSKGFDWDDLQFFLAVARAGTVSQASHRMGVDHATVMRRLDNLEKTLGAKLFERNPRGYNLPSGANGCWYPRRWLRPKCRRRSATSRPRTLPSRA